MKSRILLTFSLLLSLMFFANEGQAQSQDDLSEIKVELELNASQVKKWTLVNRSYDRKIAAVNANDELDRLEKAKEISKLYKAKDKKIQIFISDAQWEKLLAYREAKKSGN